MNKQINFDFTDIDGNLHNISVYVDAQPIVPLIEGVLSANGYEIEHKADEENQFNRFLTSELIFTWIAETPAHIAVVKDISTTNKEYWAEVAFEGSVIWKGEIIKDFNHIANTPFPRELQITAKDGLISLMNLSAEALVDENITSPLYLLAVPQVFCRAFKLIQKTGLTDSHLIGKFTFTDIRLRHSGYNEDYNYFGALLAQHPMGLKNGEETSEVLEDRLIRRTAGRDAETDSILTGSDVVNSKTFLQTEKIRDTFYTIGDVLVSYLERLDLVMFYEDNDFYVLQRGTLGEQNLKAWRFDLDYTRNVTPPFFGETIEAIDITRSTNPFGRIVYSSIFNFFPKANQVDHTLIPTLNPEINKVERIDGENFYRTAAGTTTVDYHTIISNISVEFGEFAMIFRLFGEYDLGNWSLNVGGAISRPTPRLSIRVRFTVGTDQYHYDATNQRWLLTTGTAGFDATSVAFQSNISSFTRVREFLIGEVPTVQAGDVEVHIRLNYYGSFSFYNAFQTSKPEYWIGSIPSFTGQLNMAEISDDITGIRTSVQGLAKAILPNGQKSNLVKTFKLANQTRTGVNYSRGVLHYDNNGNYLAQYRIGRIRPGQIDSLDDVFSISETWGADGASEGLSLNDIAQREMAEGVTSAQEGLEAGIKLRIPMWHRVQYDGKIYRFLGKIYTAKQNTSSGQLIQVLPKTGVSGTFPVVGIEPMLKHENRANGNQGQLQGDILQALAVATTGGTVPVGGNNSILLSDLRVDLKTGLNLSLHSPSGSFIAKVVLSADAFQGGNVEISTNTFNTVEAAPEGSLLIITMSDVVRAISSLTT